MILIAASKNVTAFRPFGIGSKVLNSVKFLHLLTTAIEHHDHSQDRIRGQHYIKMPDEANDLVSAGVGRTTKDPDDYCLREHRGRVEAFLRRSQAASTEGVAVVVYTREAYEADPDVTPEHLAWILEATHVIVAVLAFAGPAAPLGPYRFVHNLAGGNNEALTWTADEVRDKAKSVKSYWDEWSVVAD